MQPPSYEQNPSKLTDEKLAEQHDRYIKADVDGYVRPSFLITQESQNSPSQTTIATVNKQKRCCSLCDGKDHVQPGKKRHYSEKYYPVAAKRVKQS